jgi:hypothetical protein
MAPKEAGKAQAKANNSTSNATRSEALIDVPARVVNTQILDLNIPFAPDDYQNSKFAPLFAKTDLSKCEDWFVPGVNVENAKNTVKGAIKLRLAEKEKTGKILRFPSSWWDHMTEIGDTQQGWSNTWAALASLLGFPNTHVATAWMLTTEGKCVFDMGFDMSLLGGSTSQPFLAYIQQTHIIGTPLLTIF